MFQIILVKHLCIAYFMYCSSDSSSKEHLLMCTSKLWKGVGVSSKPVNLVIHTVIHIFLHSTEKHCWAESIIQLKSH